ncbi:hypothetical protein CONPUDRAFT_70424 [Coniophora puteana RWD-64-598 SS2]|uniref:C2H2-type domain-containing protein n=1 Tax=Coniophora puteana (strain RWD-64-598) TaxID=741705 RepID=A0A5M3N497_CONPW|nr:uncharacterized protein CONPUDRAFT_70424 [Coniophora puteana RWD-64-598 SS2]EIW85675.1 hypothetical protein CONPUDRAFT_70424 [Coniophora puteana RWD-64-598 SS2]
MVTKCPSKVEIAQSKPVRMRKCPYPSCTFTARDITGLKHHWNRHTGQRPYHCLVGSCDYRAVHPSNAVRHRSSIHNMDIAGFKLYCKMCNVDPSPVWDKALPGPLPELVVNKLFFGSETCNVNANDIHKPVDILTRKPNCDFAQIQAQPVMAPTNANMGSLDIPSNPYADGTNPNHVLPATLTADIAVSLTNTQTSQGYHPSAWSSLANWNGAATSSVSDYEISPVDEDASSVSSVTHNSELLGSLHQHSDAPMTPTFSSPASQLDPLEHLLEADQANQYSMDFTRPRQLDYDMNSIEPMPTANVTPSEFEYVPQMTEENFVREYLRQIEMHF